MKKDVNFDEVLNEINIDNIILKRRKNNFLLSDYQISVLNRVGINYNQFTNIKDLMFKIESILIDEDDEELDLIGMQIAEFIYYNDTNK